MSKYLITLTPLDWFFFGGEKTLANSGNEKGKKDTYFARSNLFPQQTAVMGMLRYQLLKQKGWLKNSEGMSLGSIGDIESLIGEGSFSMKKNMNFGKIKKITPLCLYKDGFFISMPLDYDMKISFEETTSVSWNNSKRLLSCDNYNQKTYNNYRCWISKQKTIQENEIFVRKMQIGITKNGGDDAFYKQEVLRLNDGLKFAFFAEINDELKSDEVYLGAQQSIFKMDVCVLDTENDVESLFMDYCPNVSKGILDLNRIVLLSDTYVRNLAKLQELCVFHWSNSTSFRNLEECATGSLHSGCVRYRKQNVLYNFLKAGSVLYFEKDKTPEIKQMLNVNSLQSIGYNYFI